MPPGLVATWGWHSQAHSSWAPVSWESTSEHQRHVSHLAKSIQYKSKHSVSAMSLSASTCYRTKAKATDAAQTFHHAELHSLLNCYSIAKICTLQRETVLFTLEIIENPIMLSEKKSTRPLSQGSTKILHT